LRKKMKLVESVLGQRLKGDTGAELVYDATSETKDLFDALRQDARRMT